MSPGENHTSQQLTESKTEIGCLPQMVFSVRRRYAVKGLQVFLSMAAMPSLSKASMLWEMDPCEGSYGVYPNLSTKGAEACRTTRRSSITGSTLDRPHTSFDRVTQPPEID